ncbi:MAG: PIN domain nuclease [Oscillospiraceae bacterium]|nr:PIN domain nuclease [Oscillospiraceae bacterium]
MKKLKLYLDTSVISHLDAFDTPEKQFDTLALWDDIIAEVYDVYLSYIVFAELDQCSEEKQEILEQYLSQIQYNEIEESDEITTLANEFIKFGTLKQKNYDDAQHIASAMFAECDVLISWNFKHMVNHKTINGIKIVSAITKYKDVSIYTPTMLVEGDDDDDI